MAKPTKVELPSGRSVLLTRLADPRRPWDVRESGGVYAVSRSRRGDSSAEERFASDRLTPLLLDKADAEALASALNAHLPTRRSHAR